MTKSPWKLSVQNDALREANDALEQRVRERARKLRLIYQGTASVTGDEFFHSLVSNLASVMGVRHCFVSEFVASRARVRTLAFWST